MVGDLAEVPWRSLAEFYEIRAQGGFVWEALGVLGPVALEPVGLFGGP